MNLKINPQAVRAQMRRINSSEGFVRCRRMQRFLEFVVEETLAGRAEQLGEYSIGIAVLDRGQDFECSLDPIVRNDARRLRNKLLEYYSQSQDSSADHILIEIPKGGYVPQFLPAPSHYDRKPAPKGHCRRLAVLPFEALSAAPDSTMLGRHSASH